MGRVARITKTVVDQLTAAGDQPAIVWDSSLPGFGVKCTSRGSKKYVVKYRAGGGGRAAQQRWVTLGNHGALTPDQARKLAQQILGRVARGEDPQDAKRKVASAATLGEVWERFEQEHLPSRKDRTRYEYRGQWVGVIKPILGSFPIAEITRGDVDRLHKSLKNAPYRANRVLALLSRLMTLSELWDFRTSGSNPCRHVQRFKESGRSRFLSSAEIQLLGNALSDLTGEGSISASAANAIRFLLITGARVSEVLTAEWKWIDWARRVITLPDSKTGEKPIFLSEAALVILREQQQASKGSNYVFPGPNAQGRMDNLRVPWEKIRSRASLGTVRLHDLRHTAASVAVGQGASLPIIGRLLGHSQAQTTQRYAHVDVDPALAAAELIGTVVSKSLSADPLHKA